MIRKYLIFILLLCFSNPLFALSSMPVDVCERDGCFVRVIVSPVVGEQGILNIVKNASALFTTDGENNDPVRLIGVEQGHVAFYVSIGQLDMNALTLISNAIKHQSGALGYEIVPIKSVDIAALKTYDDCSGGNLNTIECITD